VTSNSDREQRYSSALRDIRELLRLRRAEEAATASIALVGSFREAIEPLLLLGKARQQQGRFDDMLELARAALARDASHRGAQLQYAEACIFCGEHGLARVQLLSLEKDADDDSALLQHVAGFYAHSGKHEDAHRCYLRAVELMPDEAAALYNLASSYIAVGEIDEAERLFSRVIQLNPADHDAWQNRSTLKKQTDDVNHLAAIRQRLSELPAADPGDVPLNYALAKELEDLGEFDAGFAALSRGAAARRRRMAYDVRHDVTAMDRIRTLFDSDYAAQKPPATERTGPIFVMGLPRSGTTLVDRIISSHSQVESMGEINDFALTLTRLAKVANKNALLDTSIKIDSEQLGAGYIRSVGNYGGHHPYFIDKTPANFLYLGLIAKALPGVPVLHVRRHPVDSCLAMYRTLFRMGYPFSYDLDDLASYYIAYDRLMRHWHAVFPGIMLDVFYEELVEQQEVVTRRMIQHCNLEFEPACLQFENNRTPVATASAAQVRRPIYRDALARWRRYEKQLDPLLRRLEAANIAI
jgi:tetratricopeptide (TPR) repeat protein